MDSEENLIIKSERFPRSVYWFERRNLFCWEFQIVPENTPTNGAPYSE